MTDVVVDTSALVAMLNNEPEGGWIRAELTAASTRVIAAPTAVELGIVLEAKRPEKVGISRRVLRDGAIAVVPFDEDLSERALDAWRRFGKGRHQAALNLGDCFTYALADRTGYPILCIGDDFARTDLPIVAPASL